MTVNLLTTSTISGFIQKGVSTLPDPNYGRKTLSQDGEHLYFITPFHDSVYRVGDDFKRPNGVLGTPDGKTLYVADLGEQKTYSYTVESPDEALLKQKKLLPTLVQTE